MYHTARIIDISLGLSVLILCSSFVQTITSSAVDISVTATNYYMTETKCESYDWIDNVELSCNNDEDYIHIINLQFNYRQTCGQQTAGDCVYDIPSDYSAIEDCEGAVGSCSFSTQDDEIPYSCQQRPNEVKVTFKCFKAARLEPLCPEFRTTRTNIANNIYMYTEDFLYPSASGYRAHTACYCEAVPEPGTSLTVEGLYIDIESGPDCEYDYLRINGLNDNYEPVNEGDKYCELVNFLNEPVDHIYFPEDQKISMEFESDYSVQNRGAWFRIYANSGGRFSLECDPVNITMSDGTTDDLSYPSWSTTEGRPDTTTTRTTTTTTTPAPVLDACQSGSCAHVCTPLTNGGFECSCRDGYYLRNDGFRCRDVDECSAYNGGCAQICNNTAGSYQCSCDHGYTLDGQFNCVDINECQNGTNGGCQGDCVNTIGSSYCQCDEGYIILQGTSNCTDINECRDANGGCDHDCTNTRGSHFCTCRSGYSLGADGRSCEDKDECEDNNAGCDQACINTEGSHYCQCEEGFQIMDGIDCIDINECVTVDNGGCDHQCVNFDGGYKCECNTGYILRSGVCTDINECMVQNGGCHQECINSVGSHWCTCFDGYKLSNNTHCEDLNECSTNNGGCSTECINTAGAFHCSEDVNECLTNNGGCDHTCVNTNDGYFCTCRQGYTLEEGRYCDDTDECSRLNGGCEHTCENTDGSFYCWCDTGYVLQSFFFCMEDGTTRTTNGTASTGGGSGGGSVVGSTLNTGSPGDTAENMWYQTMEFTVAVSVGALAVIIIVSTAVVCYCVKVHRNSPKPLPADETEMYVDPAAGQPPPMFKHPSNTTLLAPSAPTLTAPNNRLTYDKAGSENYYYDPSDRNGSHQYEYIDHNTANEQRSRVDPVYQDIQNKPLPPPPSSSATYNPPHYADNAGYDIAQTLRVVNTPEGPSYTPAGYLEPTASPRQGARKESAVSIPYMVPVESGTGYQILTTSQLEEDDHTYEQLPADMKINYSYN